MPRFEITGPDGKKYQVDAPEGATEQDALAHIQQQVGAQPAMVLGPDMQSMVPFEPEPTRPFPTAAETREALQPAPNTTYGQLWPFAKDNATGVIRPALPNIARSILQGGVDLLEGPGAMQVQPASDQAPMRGPTLTPEATGTLSVIPGATPGLRLGGAPEPIPPGLAAREAPLSPEFQVNPFARPQYGPPEAPAPAPAPAPIATPKTADEAKAVANTWYAQHEAAGGAKMPADFANNFIDTIKRTAPQTEEGLAIGGETEVTKLISRAEALRDKPITLAGAQEIDEALGNLIDKQYGIKGLSKEGEQLLELQTSFREQLMNAAPAGDAGAAGAVEALKNGRAAWSQYQKMRDIERIQSRAALQDHPDTGIRSQIRALLDNPRRSRGYTDEERAALESAAKRGVIGGTLHVFGSRLVPLIAGGSGLATGGLSGMLLNAAVAHPVSAAMRAGATGLANRRVRNALSTLGEGVPMPNIFAQPP